MTEPTETKRKQPVVGAVLLAMGLAMVGQAVYFNRQDAEQSDCLVQSFSEFADNLTLRSTFTERDTLLKKRSLQASFYSDKASDRIWRTYGEAAGYLREDPTAEIPPEEALRLQKQLIDDIIHYGVVSERVAERRARLVKKNEELQQQRAQNPVPEFPDGKCD